jgi:sigma-B regulation protein RsbU (phosphoserine phosphatase)
MASPDRGRVLILKGEGTDGDLALLLRQAGVRVTEHGPEATPADLTSHDLIILDGSRRHQDALARCRRLRDMLADCFMPIVLVSAETSAAARLAILESGADAYVLRPFIPGELVAQVQAFLRLKRLHNRLSEKTVESQRTNQRLQERYEAMDGELELARRIQLSLLPGTLPEIPGIRLAVQYRPCGRVGGDFYDVFRLDEEHVGFYVADVVGHGVPASLITMFLKKAVRAKEINGREYRLLPPEEVLHDLNREMLQQALADNPFITIVYALYNCRERVLSFARAGHPYPFYLPAGGEPVHWRSHGTLLGVFETKFEPQRHILAKGDKVLIYTDGLETASEKTSQNDSGDVSALAKAHRMLPISELVPRLSRELIEQTKQPDDFTMLGLEIL